ncbi:MAG: 3-oxoacyl-ACP reductase FabG [Alicyclobacillus sp.]|nr:3-oxoacyl-ACP reductase FabG [Alicyclobacillus sp.]
MIDLSNKVSIVTGAARGLGKGIAEKLAKLGAFVYVVDINDTGVASTVDEFLECGLKVKGLVVDVADEVSANACIESVYNEMGRIDILVNNAGINRDAMVHKMTHNQWEEVIKVNLTGVFHMTQPTIRVMRDQKYGRIVNISSISKNGNIGQANYAAAKAGVIGFTKTVAREMAKHGITVNAICPGFIETDMTLALKDVKFNGPYNTVWDFMISKIPMGYAGCPEDVANMVAFLVSDHAGYITGEVINVSGGMVL